MGPQTMNKARVWAWVCRNCKAVLGPQRVHCPLRGRKRDTPPLSGRALGGALSRIGGSLAFVLIALGCLWELIDLVKWMWQQS